MEYVHRNNGKPYRSHSIKAVRRADRRCGIVSARQQRKRVKAWRAEQRSASLLVEALATPLTDKDHALVNELVA